MSANPSDRLLRRLLALGAAPAAEAADLRPTRAEEEAFLRAWQLARRPAPAWAGAPGVGGGGEPWLVSWALLRTGLCAAGASALLALGAAAFNGSRHADLRLAEFIDDQGRGAAATFLGQWDER